jgi:hypothetical protein
MNPEERDLGGNNAHSPHRDCCAAKVVGALVRLSFVPLLRFSVEGI